MLAIKAFSIVFLLWFAVWFFMYGVALITPFLEMHSHG